MAVHLGPAELAASKRLCPIAVDHLPRSPSQTNRCDLPLDTVGAGLFRLLQPESAREGAHSTADTAPHLGSRQRYPVGRFPAVRAAMVGMSIWERSVAGEKTSKGAAQPRMGDGYGGELAVE
jgi:hypothetical protein